jgi:hypothetical protein
MNLTRPLHQGLQEEVVGHSMFNLFVISGGVFLFPSKNLHAHLNAGKETVRDTKYDLRSTGVESCALRTLYLVPRTARTFQQ